MDRQRKKGIESGANSSLSSSLPLSPHTACLSLPPLLYDLIAARRLCRRRSRFCNLQSPIEEERNERRSVGTGRTGMQDQMCFIQFQVDLLSGQAQVRSSTSSKDMHFQTRWKYHSAVGGTEAERHQSLSFPWSFYSVSCSLSRSPSLPPFFADRFPRLRSINSLDYPGVPRTDT